MELGLALKEQEPVIGPDKDQEDIVNGFVIGTSTYAVIEPEFPLRI
jgi:hypothetical protein